MNKYFKNAISGIIYIFALIGFVMVGGFVAIRLGWTNVKSLVDNQEVSFLTANVDGAVESPLATTTVDAAWQKSEEWQVIKKAITKDMPVIERAAKDADVEPRLIIAILIPEQMRVFTDDRELFKKVLAPLGIIVSQNQFSWGIMGIKRDTALDVERHLGERGTVFYPGPQYENLLDFKTTDIENERFSRITNEKDHYYGYLYAALFIKQLETQWQKAGFDITKRPDIIATLYNIGFGRSHPNPDPHSGGAEITIDGKTYSFGSLASSFYFSSEFR